MPYKNHERLETPSDNVKIWRYIDLPAFLYILQENKLFFRRVDKFEDPFEATIPVVVKEIYKNYVKSLQEAGLTQVNEETYINERKVYRKSFYINAWHMNKEESAAMWKVYSCMNKGIAIQSTVGRLKESLNICTEHDVYLGSIKYIDYKAEELPEINLTKESSLEVLNLLVNACLKRKSFEFENELRAIVWIPPKGNPIDPAAPDAKEKLQNQKTIYEFYEGASECLEVDININKLIEKVYVSPNAEEWFKNIIENVAENSNILVEYSKLSDKPIY